MLNDLLILYPDANPNVLQLYIGYATKLLENYLNNPRLTFEDIQEKYSFAIVQIVGNAWEIKQRGGQIKSITQGARSVTYLDGTAFAITSDIASLLPRPFIRLF